MKRITPILGMTIALLLSGCSCSLDFDLVGFKEVKRDVFNTTTSALNNPAVSMDAAKNREVLGKKEVTFKMHPDYQNVPYCDFSTYASLVANTFTVEGVTYECDGKTFVIRNKAGQNMYVARVDYDDKMVYFAGSVTYATTTEEEVASMYGALLADADIEQKVIVEGVDNYTRASFASYDLPTYFIHGEFVAPLAFFDSAFGSSLSVYHFNDFKEILQYNSILSFVLPISPEGKSATQEVQAYYDENGMPYDLRRLEKASLYFVMDNYYGLQTHKHISSMSGYLNTHGIGKDLLSDDEETRCYAMQEAFAILNDDHSGVSTMAPHWGDKAEYQHRGQLSQDRQMLKKSLVAQRSAALGTTSTAYGIDEEVHYSTSGKTAYFYFDSFIFDTKPFDPTNRDNLWHTDSYFYFVHQLEAIKAHGGVENVIIDDSCNGGGTVGVAVKLLALLSKDNYGYDRTQNLQTGAITELSARVDSNQDGKYDEDDVYGDDFNIAILTGPNSFSCGNLLPVMCKYTGNAKLIGRKSGGGECVVGSTYLPSGRGIQLSSLTRLVTLQEDGSYRGVENGASVDIELNYADFYNIDKIETLLNQ